MSAEQIIVKRTRGCLGHLATLSIHSVIAVRAYVDIMASCVGTNVRKSSAIIASQPLKAHALALVHATSVKKAGTARLAIRLALGNAKIA